MGRIARRIISIRTGHQWPCRFQYPYRASYKGNFHLLATIDGKECKYVIGKNKEAFALIEKTGIANLTTEQLKAMAEKYFKLSE